MRLFGRRRKADRGVPAYSNEAVIERIQQDAGVDRDTARLWFNEMLLFLDLVADSRDFLSPPKPVDAAWHAFILHTRDYEAYCLDRFGRVIHHEPTGKPHSASYLRAYDRRARLGPIDGAVWAVPVWGGDAGTGARHAAGGDVAGGFGGGDWGGGASCGGGGGGG
jgi:hypothetical protein